MLKEPISLTVLGTGSSASIPVKDCSCEQCEEARADGLSKRMSPCLMVDYDRTLLLFDCGPDVRTQLRDIIPEVVFVTHKHADHWEGVTELAEGAIIYLRRGGDFEDLKVEPFPVLHSSSVTTVGFVLKGKVKKGKVKLVYAPAFFKIPDPVVLNNADVAFIDGSDIIAKGEDIFKTCKERKVKNVVVMHIGHCKLNHVNLTVKVREIATSAGYKIDNVYVARDRIQYKVTEDDFNEATSGTPGMVKHEELSKVGQLIAPGGVEGAALLPRRGDLVGQPGDSPSDASLSLDTLKKYDNSIKGNGKILDTVDIDYYDPAELNAGQLRDDWRILCAMYKHLKKGEQLRLNTDQLIALGGKVTDQFIHRGEGIFQVDGMDDETKEYFNKVKEAVEKSGRKVPIEKIFAEEEVMLDRATQMPAPTRVGSATMSRVDQAKTHKHPLPGHPGFEERDHPISQKHANVEDAKERLRSVVDSIKSKLDYDYEGIVIPVSNDKGVNYRECLDGKGCCRNCANMNDAMRRGRYWIEYKRSWCPVVGFVDDDMTCDAFAYSDEEVMTLKKWEMGSSEESQQPRQYTAGGLITDEDLEEEEEENKGKTPVIQDDKTYDSGVVTRDPTAHVPMPVMASEDMEKGPPGAPPRAGLEWKEETHRWIRPDKLGIQGKEKSNIESKYLEPLAKEALKYDNYDDFETAFLHGIKHGRYYHITDDPNFTVDPERGPRDRSSMAMQDEPDKGKFMMTSDLGYWLDEYPKRKYVAIVDMSQVPKGEYQQVNRGFGNEFFVNDPSKAKVVKVVSRAEAENDNKKHQEALENKITGRRDLEDFYNKVHGKERSHRKRAGVRSLDPDQVQEAKEEMGTLAGYSQGSIRYFLGSGTKYWNEGAYQKAKAGKSIRVFRAVPNDINNIHLGAYVTQSKEYAQLHLDSILGGEGHIIEGEAKADDLIAVSENEFYFAPASSEVEKGPPGAPPRPGLQWKEETKRWIRPEELASPAEHKGIGGWSDYFLGVIDQSHSDISEIIHNSEQPIEYRKMFEFLEGYTLLAIEGKRYPDNKLDRLFISAVKGLPNIKEEYNNQIKSYYDHPTIKPAFEKLLAKVDDLILEGMKAKSADSRFGKVALIDAFAHLQHTTGSVIPVAFGIWEYDRADYWPSKVIADLSVRKAMELEKQAAYRGTGGGRSGLVPKRVRVTRDGKTFETTVYVNPNKEDDEVPEGKFINYEKEQEKMHSVLAAIKSKHEPNLVELGDKFDASTLYKIYENADEHIKGYQKFFDAETFNNLRNTSYIMARAGSKVVKTPRELQALIDDCTDKMIYQEACAWQRQMSDHGIRHIYYDMDVQRRIFRAIRVGSQQKLSPKEELISMVATINHDIGYTTKVAATPEGTKKHPKASKEWFDAEKHMYEKIFSEEEIAKIGEVIERHGENYINWEKDPVMSAMNVSDNLSLFYEDKIPSLFRYVPDAIKSLGDMQKALRDKDQKAFLMARKGLFTKIDKSELLGYTKSWLKLAAANVATYTPKFTIPLYIGHVMGFDYESKTGLLVDISEDLHDTTIADYIDMGQDKFVKFAKDYGVDVADNSDIRIQKEGKDLLRLRIHRKEKNVEKGYSVEDFLQDADDIIKGAIKDRPGMYFDRQAHRWKKRETSEPSERGVSEKQSRETMSVVNRLIDSIKVTGKREGDKVGPTVKALKEANLPESHLITVNSIEINARKAEKKGGGTMAYCDGANNIVLAGKVGNENIIHEIGHTFFKSRVLVRDNPHKWDIAYAFNASTKTGKGFVSEYARTDAEEFFAECYAAYAKDAKALTRLNPTMGRILKGYWK